MDQVGQDRPRAPALAPVRFVVAVGLSHAPLTRDRDQLTKRAAADDLARLLHLLVIASMVADQNVQAFVFRRSNERVGLGQCRGDRLFHQKVTSGFKSDERRLQVMLGRRRHDNARGRDGS